MFSSTVSSVVLVPTMWFHVHESRRTDCNAPETVLHSDIDNGWFLFIFMCSRGTRSPDGTHSRPNAGRRRRPRRSPSSTTPTPPSLPRLCALLSAPSPAERRMASITRRERLLQQLYLGDDCLYFVHRMNQRKAEKKRVHSKIQQSIDHCEEQMCTNYEVWLR